MKPFYSIMFVASVTTLVASVIAIAVYGFAFGVDFTGGSMWEIAFDQGRPDLGTFRNALETDGAFTGAEISPIGDRSLVIRTTELAESDHAWALQMITTKFKENAPRETRFDSVGPAIGSELRSRSITAIIILLGAVLLYIAYMFRALSRSLSLWAMAAGTIVSLAHDILIPMGIFALLGHFSGVQITGIYVAAVLTILGYTVSDKVVIYDRVRENILRGSKDRLPDVVHASVQQTLVRSINNTLVVVLSSLAVFLFGGESIKYFALALMLGIGLGAYSSIFVAAPMLVWMSRRKQ